MTIYCYKNGWLATDLETGIEMGGLMKRFDNRTVVVTGGGGGIGGATCRRFAEQAARVAVFDLNIEAA
jgi:FlaA1/EpsC-like NDP-sugar epimerase